MSSANPLSKGPATIVSYINLDYLIFFIGSLSITFDTAGVNDGLTKSNTWVTDFDFDFGIHLS